MEPEGFEDMLFNFSSSQESLDDVEFDSEEEMLGDGVDSDFDLWDQPGDTMLSPAPTDIDLDVDMLHGTDEAAFETEELYEHDACVDDVKDRGWVIAQVEKLLEGVVDGLLDDDNELSITLRCRPGKSRLDPRLPGQKGVLLPSKTREISFPGANAQEAWRFSCGHTLLIGSIANWSQAVLLRILELIHDCLVDDVVMTKRDMYYRHPDLFVNQSVVDRYVDDLAYTFGVSRSLLNVTAAAKGLIAGNFILRRADGTSIIGTSEPEGILIPRIESPDALDLSAVHWILVIEKEATFRTVLSSPQWMRLGSRGLIVTAKGYPDLTSRKFLGKIADLTPWIPMYALVDFDPDGIAIMSTYKHGSYRLAHENIATSGAPAIHLPKLRWLGVQSHQCSRTPATERDTEPSAMLDAQGIMRLTPRDRRKAGQMLEWDVCAEGGPEREWRRELQTMLMLNIKAEMQILEELPGGLISWLESELEGGAGMRK